MIFVTWTYRICCLVKKVRCMKYAGRPHAYTELPGRRTPGRGNWVAEEQVYKEKIICILGAFTHFEFCTKFIFTHSKNKIDDYFYIHQVMIIHIYLTK